MADVGKVLDCERISVTIALEHNCFGLIRVEKDFVLKRAFVLFSHNFDGFFRQTLPFVNLAGFKLDPWIPLISPIVPSFDIVSV